MAISTVAQSIFNVGKDHITDLTKYINESGATSAIDTFMDSVTGRGHRIVFGHDLSSLPDVYQKFGLDGIYDYFKHLGKDVMSPDGIPIPFAREIQQSIGLSTKQSLDWMCLNIGDVLSGGFSIWHTREILSGLQSGDITRELLLKITIGSGIKVFFSIQNPNPISLVCGVIDFGALLYYAFPTYSSYLVNVLQDELTWSQIFENSVKITGIGFATSFALEGLTKVRSLVQKEITFKRYLREIAKKAAIDGLISGGTSLVADLSEKYLNISKTTKSFIAFGTFTGIKYTLKKINKRNTIENSTEMIDFKCIPSLV